ncbi:MAG: ATP-dependent metallopeptidase FtsH/Yme1/Tma family protein, partial [Bacteriovorax sp.]|nr:ATP-dependent metallopeptidase FtsH/Yme1/Tma family protein [Bacteriovorax sp.]
MNNDKQDIKLDKKKELQKSKYNITFYIVFILVLFLIQEFYKKNYRYESVPYNEFKSLLSAGKIKEIVVYDKELRGILKVPGANKELVVVSNLVDPVLSSELDKFNIKYSKVTESTLLGNIFSWVVPTFVFFAVWFYLSK